MRGRRRTGGAATLRVVALALLLSASACVPDPGAAPPPGADPTADRPAGPTEPVPAGTGTTSPGGATEYRPGRGARVEVPTGARAVVVLVPGGGWRTADPTGLRPLAQHLAAAGVATVTITYGTSSTGDHFPVPAQDVACAVAFAATAVPDVPVALLGHSAGAHLAVLVGLTGPPAPLASTAATPRPTPRTGTPEAEPCPHAARDADAVVGLAGPYDLVRAERFAHDLLALAPDEDPAAWAAADPLRHAALRPELPVLLVHGADDRVVPPSSTLGLADAFRAGGHDAAVEVLPDVDHLEVLDPAVVGDVVVAWLGEAVGAP
ncbi:alpha/beta hydrolase [Actinotalea sp. AC32]|nr:alpha/beta hydrolase [Actinotalea sp. AC32]